MIQGGDGKSPDAIDLQKLRDDNKAFQEQLDAAEKRIKQLSAGGKVDMKILKYKTEAEKSKKTATDLQKKLDKCDNHRSRMEASLAQAHRDLADAKAEAQKSADSLQKAIEDGEKRAVELGDQLVEAEKKYIGQTGSQVAAKKVADLREKLKKAQDANKVLRTDYDAQKQKLADLQDAYNDKTTELENNWHQEQAKNYTAKKALQEAEATLWDLRNNAPDYQGLQKRYNDLKVQAADVQEQLDECRKGHGQATDKDGDTAMSDGKKPKYEALQFGTANNPFIPNDYQTEIDAQARASMKQFLQGKYEEEFNRIMQEEAGADANAARQMLIERFNYEYQRIMQEDTNDLEKFFADKVGLFKLQKVYFDEYRRIGQEEKYHDARAVLQEAFYGAYQRLMKAEAGADAAANAPSADSPLQQYYNGEFQRILKQEAATSNPLQPNYHEQYQRLLREEAVANAPSASNPLQTNYDEAYRYLLSKESAAGNFLQSDYKGEYQRILREEAIANAPSADNPLQQKYNEAYQNLLNKERASNPLQQKYEEEYLRIMREEADKDAAANKKAADDQKFAEEYARIMAEENAADREAALKNFMQAQFDEAQRRILAHDAHADLDEVKKAAKESMEHFMSLQEEAIREEDEAAESPSLTTSSQYSPTFEDQGPMQQAFVEACRRILAENAYTEQAAVRRAVKKSLAQFEKLKKQAIGSKTDTPES
ncbi:hypothetical protein F5Y16DRAFT_384444 [Xylariaceae sp. FL0255]|nr:hypothetical protein F5Y16DRAFT_384444 [Xylariaceae sp. FL0255]